jgi:polyhydroxyalkanoate synthesis regulator phasin
MSSKKKVIAIAITTVALTAGSFGIADAASKSKVTKTKYTQTSTTKGIANPMANGFAGPGQELNSVLAALVTKGTITQAQADAITAAYVAAESAAHANDPMRGPKGGPLDDKITIVTSTLGIDSATLISRLKAGETLATIAGAKKAALISALVADETKKIDAAVTAGKLTAAQATELKANLTAHVTAEVEATAPVGGPQGGKGGPMGAPKGDKGGRGHGGPMGGGPMGGAAPTIPAPTTSSN